LFCIYNIEELIKNEQISDVAGTDEKGREKNRLG
jgi:hypothetical protein